MLVEHLWTPSSEVAVSGEGYAPDGELVAGGALLDPADVSAAPPRSR